MASSSKTVTLDDMSPLAVTLDPVLYTKLVGLLNIYNIHTYIFVDYKYSILSHLKETLPSSRW